MSDKKKRYNCCKEKGSLGKREEIVLRKNHRRLVEKLEVTDDFIDLLFEVGILDPDEYKAVLDAPANRAVRRILADVQKSGLRSFEKFMDALRMAGYNEVAADLEQELENTAEYTNTNREISKIQHGSSDNSCLVAENLRIASSVLAIGAEVVGVLSAANPYLLVAGNFLTLGSQICGAASTGYILHSSISNYKGTDSEKAKIVGNVLAFGCQGAIGVSSACKLGSSISKLGTAKMAADKQVQAGIQKLSSKELGKLRLLDL